MPTLVAPSGAGLSCGKGFSHSSSNVPRRFRFLDLLWALTLAEYAPGKAASHCIQRSVRGQARVRAFEKDQAFYCLPDRMFSALVRALPSALEFFTLTVRVKTPLSFCRASSVMAWAPARERSAGRIPTP
jgi:hypothetical protein